MIVCIRNKVSSFCILITPLIMLIKLITVLIHDWSTLQTCSNRFTLLEDHINVTQIMRLGALVGKLANFLP